MKAVLDRYILSECIPSLGLSLGVFTFVLLMQRLLKLSDLVIAKGVPLLEVARLLGLAFPVFLPLILPVSLLLAVLLAMGRLSADSEIVAMRACGVSLGRTLRPVMLLSALVCGAAGAVSLWLQPLASASFRDVLYETVKNRISATVLTGTFSELASGLTLFAEGIDRESGVLTGLFLHMDRDPTRGAWVLAREGSVRDVGTSVELDLTDGEVHQYQGPGHPYRRLSFRKYRLLLPLPATEEKSPDVEEQPSLDLFRAALSGRADGQHRLELHRRLAMPASCLVFGLLGASLGVHHTRAGRSRAVTLCLALLLLYYSLLTTAKALGHRGTFPPELAMWLPNIVLGGLGVYAFARKNREAPLPLEEAAAAAIRLLRATSLRLLGVEPRP